MSEIAQQDITKIGKAIRGAKDNSESIGVSLAGLLTWYATQQGIPVPPELIATLSGALGAVAGRLRQAAAQ